MGVSHAAPDPGLEADGSLASRPSRVGPAQRRPSCSWTETELLLSRSGAGAERGAREGKGSLCSLLLPPALCLWENCHWGHWPGLFPCGVHYVFVFFF